MTVRVQITNTGNSKADLVQILRNGLPQGQLERGQSLDLDQQADYRFAPLREGSEDDGALEPHTAVAICTSQPGLNLVRASFKPSGNPAVDNIKLLAAGLANAIYGIRPELFEASPDSRIALRKLAEASMWAVRDLTGPGIPNTEPDLRDTFYERAMEDSTTGMAMEPKNGEPINEAEETPVTFNARRFATHEADALVAMIYHGSDPDRLDNAEKRYLADKIRANQHNSVF